MLYLVEHVSHFADYFIIEADSEEEAEEVVQKGTNPPCGYRTYADDSSMTFVELSEHTLPKPPGSSEDGPGEAEDDRGEARPVAERVRALGQVRIPE